jgi:chloramphenicol 3-O-phosphotransferase
VLATAVLAVHFLVLAHIVLGAFLAWRWPRALLVHVPFVLWGLGIVLLGFVCPLTELENWLRGRGGNPDGFIAEYLDGVLSPDEYLVASRVLAGVAVVVSYVGAIVAWRRRRAASGPRFPAYRRGPTTTGC